MAFIVRLLRVMAFIVHLLDDTMMITDFQGSRKTTPLHSAPAQPSTGATPDRQVMLLKPGSVDLVLPKPVTLAALREALSSGIKS